MSEKLKELEELAANGDKEALRQIISMISDKAPEPPETQDAESAQLNFDKMTKASLIKYINEQPNGKKNFSKPLTSYKVGEIREILKKKTRSSDMEKGSYNPGWIDDMSLEVTNEDFKKDRERSRTFSRTQSARPDSRVEVKCNLCKKTMKVNAGVSMQSTVDKVFTCRECGDNKGPRRV